MPRAFCLEFDVIIVSNIKMKNKNVNKYMEEIFPTMGKYFLVKSRQTKKWRKFEGSSSRFFHDIQPLNTPFWSFRLFDLKLSACVSVLDEVQVAEALCALVYDWHPREGKQSKQRTASRLYLVQPCQNTIQTGARRRKSWCAGHFRFSLSERL